MPATRTDNQRVSITQGVDELLCREAVHGGHLHRGRLGVTKLAHHLRDGILGRRTSLLRHYRVLRHDGRIAGPGTRGNFIDRQNGERAQPSISYAEPPSVTRLTGRAPGRVAACPAGDNALWALTRDGDGRSWR
jgi:hypothetical protein